VHHSVGWYFFVVGVFLMWALGAADSVHKLKQPDGKSVIGLGTVWSWIVLLLCIALMLIMIGVAIIALMKGML